jgi:ABC-2 type transport system permease protein
MIRGNKVGIVARWEFSSLVRRLPFLLFTFGMPLFFTLLFGGVAMVQEKALAGQNEQARLFGLVDAGSALGGHLEPVAPLEPEARTRLLRAGLAPSRALTEDDVVFERFDTEAEARRALSRKLLGGYFVIGKRYMQTGAVRLVEAQNGPLAELGASGAEHALGVTLRRALLRGRVPDGVLDRTLNPVVTERATLRADGRVARDEGSDVTRMLVPLFLALLLMMSLISTSSYLVQGVAVEKENKLVEVLLSSASADEILAGKLVGLGAAGLLQVGIWCSMLGGVALTFASRVASAGLYVPWPAVFAAVPLFLLGYLFIGSLMLATGSLGNTMRESQQLAMAWSIPTVLPLMLMSVLMSQPHGTLSRVMSWIPFTAPLTVVTRLSLDPDGISAAEILGSALVLALSTWLATKLAARLFRVGLLLTGARPRLGDLLRQAALGR